MRRGGKTYDPDEECYRRNRNGQHHHARTGGRRIRPWCGGGRGNRGGCNGHRALRILEARIEKLSIGTLTVDHLNLGNYPSAFGSSFNFGDHLELWRGRFQDLAGKKSGTVAGST